MESITDFINTVGFPILVCIVCFGYIKNTTSQMLTVIQNNTKILTLVCQHLGILDEMEEKEKDKD